MAEHRLAAFQDGATEQDEDEACDMCGHSIYGGVRSLDPQEAGKCGGTIPGEDYDRPCQCIEH